MKEKRVIFVVIILIMALVGYGAYMNNRKVYVALPLV